jgi:hypothetical protein
MRRARSSEAAVCANVAEKPTTRYFDQSTLSMHSSM